MDYGLHDQHSYLLNQRVQEGHETDFEASWVMLSQSGQIEKLPGETMIFQTRGRIALDLTAERQTPGSDRFSRKSDSGTAYITTQRVIYLPSKPTAEFKSFASRILDCLDSRVQSSWFGPWYWEAIFRPVPGGNIPSDISLGKAQLSFNDGGANDFHTKFVEMKSQLHHVAQIAEETGQTQLLYSVHGEQLPEYTPRQAGPPSAEQPGSADAPSDAAQQSQPASQQQGDQQQQQVPDEDPPNYDEAQMQAVNMRFDERAREEAGRD